MRLADGNLGSKVENFKPLQDWVLLEPIKDDVSKGGVVMPQGVSAAGDLGRLKVIAVGPGALLHDGTRDPMPVKAGDFIWRVGQVRPIEILLDGKKYCVMQAREFIAVDTRGEDPEPILDLPAKPKIAKDY
jgi:chaperonin GroES